MFPVLALLFVSRESKMGDDHWKDENAMKYLDRAMKVPCPMISFVTGPSADSKIGQKYRFNEADLGPVFVSLFAGHQWDPFNECVMFADSGPATIKFDDYNVGVYWGNIAPRFDQKYERIAAYRNSYCIFMLYTALSASSFEYLKKRIEEAQAICSDLLHIPTPMMVIIGLHYHCPAEDIQVPFDVVQEYASGIGLKAYQTFGADKAEQAKSIVYDVIRLFVDKGMLMKDGGPSNFLYTKAIFEGADPKSYWKKTVKKRSRCIIS